MSKQWLIRTLQATVITVTLVAVCQELEKPREERRWHGKVAGFIPYDFRLPTTERFKESDWNPDDSRVVTARVLGIGWAINFYTLLEYLRVIGRGDVSEESFLMPTKSIKDILKQASAAD